MSDEQLRTASSDRIADLATAIVDVTANHVASDVLLALCFVLAEIELQMDKPDASRIVRHVQGFVPAILDLMLRIKDVDPDVVPGELFSKTVKH